MSLLDVNDFSPHVPICSDTSKEGQRKKGSVPSGQLLLLPGYYRGRGVCAVALAFMIGSGVKKERKALRAIEVPQ